MHWPAAALLRQVVGSESEQVLVAAVVRQLPGRAVAPRAQPGAEEAEVALDVVAVNVQRLQPLAGQRQQPKMAA